MGILKDDGLEQVLRGLLKDKMNVGKYQQIVSSYKTLAAYKIIIFNFYT